MAQQKVLFKFGTQAQYLSLENKLDNALYFLTDTGELYKGETAIARSRVYKGLRSGAENNTTAITRLVGDSISVEGDICIIINADNSIDAFVKDHENGWTQINNASSDLTNRVAALETAVAALPNVFSFKGIKATLAELNAIENPKNGDVYQVDNAEFVWNGSEWVELGTPIDLSNYVTLTDLEDAVGDLEALIGKPSHQEEDETTGDLVTVPATGIYDMLANHADQIIPLFNGSIAGLVPVASDELTVEQKAHRFLNALGEWTVISSSGGQSSYTAPDGRSFTNIEDYVSYMVENYAEILWESMSE